MKDDELLYKYPVIRHIVISRNARGKGLCMESILKLSEHMHKTMSDKYKGINVAFFAPYLSKVALRNK